jgi:hypothetical protein
MTNDREPKGAAQYGDGVVDVVRARRIEVFDDEGRLRGSIGMQGDDFGMLIESIDGHGDSWWTADLDSSELAFSGEGNVRLKVGTQFGEPMIDRFDGRLSMDRTDLAGAASPDQTLTDKDRLDRLEFVCADALSRVDAFGTRRALLPDRDRCPEWCVDRDQDRTHYTKELDGDPTHLSRRLHPAPGIELYLQEDSDCSVDVEMNVHDGGARLTPKSAADLASAITGLLALAAES